VRIQRQQAVRFLRVAAGSGLPLEQAAPAIEASYGVDVGDKLIVAGHRMHKADTLVTAGTTVKVNPSRLRSSLKNEASDFLR